jgi:WD40 repeat protein
MKIMSKAVAGLGVVLAAGVIIWALGLTNTSAQSNPGRQEQTKVEKKTIGANQLVAQAPQAQAPRAQTPRAQVRPDPNRPTGDFVLDTIVIPHCQLNVDEKTELSTQREGVLLFVGRPVKSGEIVPRDHADQYLFDGEFHPYRRLKEGDIVEPNEVLGRIDDRLALAEKLSKENKLKAAVADQALSVKTKEEARARYDTQVALRRTRATSDEDLRAAKLGVEKYVADEEQKKAAVEVAKAELKQTETVLGLHEIRSKIGGQVRTIYKHKGEEVKNLEPILLIRNLDTLRAEGMVDVHFLPRLAKGMKVLVEQEKDQPPHYQPFIGHLQPVTGVAVSKDSRNIVSVSEDRTARVWNLGGQRQIIDVGVGLRSVACTPPGAAGNFFAVGATDGTVRLYDLDADKDEPVQTFDLDSKHRGPVHCIAFNKDGTICATGGEDRDIRIWDVASGQLKFKLSDHHGPVTSLQFTPQDQLVSAGKDNVIMLWSIGSEPKRIGNGFPKRSGEVAVLGASPDGKSVLYDAGQSKALRVLSLPEGLHRGIIRNPPGSEGFKTLALFSPDGRFVLTGESTEGLLQLWTVPTETSRAFQIRRLTLADPSSVTCAAFAPNNSFVVAGTKDRMVVAWGPLPTEKDVAEFRIPAVISNIDHALDAGSHQVRIFAEFTNPKGPDGVGILMPGSTVTLVVPPESKK